MKNHCHENFKAYFSNLLTFMWCDWCLWPLQRFFTVSWLSLNAVHHSHAYVYDSASFVNLLQVFSECQLVWNLRSSKTWIHIVAPPSYRFTWMPSCGVTKHRCASVVNVWRKRIWNECAKITFIHDFVYVREKENSGSTLNHLCIPFINPWTFQTSERRETKYMHKFSLKHSLEGFTDMTQ
jgi:hypothetical protein